MRIKQCDFGPAFTDLEMAGALVGEDTPANANDRVSAPAKYGIQTHAANAACQLAQWDPNPHCRRHMLPACAVALHGVC